MSSNFFDKSVRKKLEGHEAPVPADAWANIQKGKKKKRPLLLVWLLAILLLGGGASVYYYSKQEANELLAKKEGSLLQQNKILPADSNNLPAANAGASISTNDPSVKAGDNRDSGAKPVDNINASTGQDNKLLAKVDAGEINQDQQAAVPSKKGKTNNRQKNNAGIIAAVTSFSDNNETKNRSKRSAGNGRQNIKISAPGVVAESTGTEWTAAENETVLWKDSIHDAGATVNAVTAAEKTTGKDSVVNNDHKEPAAMAQKNKPSQKKAGIEIGFGFSGFMPVGNQARLSSISRTMETDMHKAEFTADKISIRLQPSVGLDLTLYKAIAPRLKAGAGIRFQQVKEYIQLSGNEINTRYTLVKRLQNNVLVDDTVATVSRGIRNIDAVNSYNFVSIPLSIRYQLMQRSYWMMDLQAGIDINISSRYSNSIEGQLQPQFNNPAGKKHNRSIGTGFNAGLMISRRAGRHYWLYASPYLQLNPGKLYLEKMLTPVSLHRTGIAFGIIFKP